MCSGWRTLTMTLTQKQTDASWATKRRLEDWTNCLHVEMGEDMWSACSSVHVLALEKTTCGRKNCTTLRFRLLLVAKRKCFLNISPVNSEYGFYRHENTSECLLQPDFLNQTKDICLNGELDDLQSSGWWWNISWFPYNKTVKLTHVHIHLTVITIPLC